MPTRTRIDANGNVVSNSSEASSDENDDDSVTFSCPSFLRLQRAIDTFGFNLDLKQFICVVVVVALMLGPRGGKQYFERKTPSR